MTLKYFAGLLITGTHNDRIGLSTTNLPVGWRFLETDTRQMYYWDGTLWMVLGQSVPSSVKWGFYYGAATLSTGSDFLNGKMSVLAVGTGTTAAVSDSTGTYRSVDTAGTINSLSGQYTNQSMLMRSLNAYFRAQIQLNNNTNMRVFVGLAASASAPASSADPLNALEGIGLWFDDGVSANWKYMHNDNSGASTVDAIGGGVAASTGTLYTVEIEAKADTKFTISLNGANVTDISTNIPGSTTSLSHRVYLENTTGASRVMRHYSTTIRSDK